MIFFVDCVIKNTINVDTVVPLHRNSNSQVSQTQVYRTCDIAVLLLTIFLLIVAALVLGIMTVAIECIQNRPSDCHCVCGSH